MIPRRRVLLNCPPEEDQTKQEFKAESDINNLMRRHGAGIAPRQVIYGHEDSDLDLQTALQSIQEARTAHRNLPDDLRGRYPSWQSLLLALDRGELKLSTEEPKPKGPTPPEPPPVTDPA